MIEAMKQMLEALEWCHGGEPIGTAEAIKAGKQAIADLENQEPVAHRDGYWCASLTCKKCYSADFRLKHTTHPPQRTWQGLTNNELQPIADEYRILFGSWVEDFARAIEAKLKDKNCAG
jgi:hypothetical protein